jgi:methyl-accepting chemotaxis protein
MPFKKKEHHELISFPMAMAAFTAFAVGIVFGVIMQPNVINLRYTPPSISVSAPMPSSASADARDELIKSEVQTAYSMLGALNAKVQSGALTLAQAKKIGADTLREMRYGTDGYFFADTSKGVNVVLPGQPDVEGTNRYNAQLAGVNYVQQIIAAGLNGGGYTDYSFQKLGETNPAPKRAYSMYFAPFDWNIGTGYYK